MSALQALAETVRSRGGLLADTVTDPTQEGSLGALAGPGYAELVEAIYEGYLQHYGDGRVLRPQDPDLALLAGDRLYALGLAHLAELGDLEAVAGEQREVRVLGADDAARPVVLEVPLDDRLDEQRVGPLAAGGARPGRREGAERPVVAPHVGDGGGDQPAVGAERVGQPVERLLGHAISAKAAAATSSVRVTCAGVCASDGNQASNCDGGG